MVFGHCLSKALRENVRIDLSCRDIAVTEHFFETDQIDSMLKKMRGESMT
jgi:hypothetical protein